MNNQKINEFMYKVSVSEDPVDVYNAWNCVKSEYGTYKTIVSLKKYSKSVIDKVIRDKFDDIDSGFVSYFEASNLYFVSNKGMYEMIQNGTVNYKIDYSIMFDTNFAGYIDDFVRTGKINTASNNVYSAIDMLLQNDFRYDYNFYLIENSKYFSNNEFCVDKNIDMFNNIVSLELFKSIDRTLYCSEKKIRYKISMDQAIEQANNIVDMMYNSDAGKEYCNLFKKLHKQMLLTLIEIMYINFSSKLGANKKIEQYFSYVNDILGIYMDREAVIAHKYFSKNSDIQIFKRVNKNMKKDKLRDVLNNVAWDFTISRIMEMVMMSCGEGDFFVPIFLSFDRDLRSVMNSFSIKGILINFNELKVIPIPSINTKEYFIKNNCYDYLEKLFAPTLPESRIKTYRDNESSDYVIIEQEFEKLVNVLCSG